MPFDPKLVPADKLPQTAGGDLELPADLKTLAGQLEADAAHLARCYPPRQDLTQPAMMALSARRRVVTRYAGWGVFALLVIATLGFWLGTTISSIQGVKQESVAASNMLPAGTEDSQLVPPDTSDPNGIAISDSSAELSLSGLTGPELEALLDVLESEPGIIRSIAF